MEDTVQWPSVVWEIEETGWERRMESGGRVAARALEKDCVPVHLTLGGWMEKALGSTRGLSLRFQVCSWWASPVRKRRYWPPSFLSDRSTAKPLPLLT